MILYSILIAVNARIDPNSLKKIMTGLLFNRIDYDDVIIVMIASSIISFWLYNTVLYFSPEYNLSTEQMITNLRKICQRGQLHSACFLICIKIQYFWIYVIKIYFINKNSYF